MFQGRGQAQEASLLLWTRTHSQNLEGSALHSCGS